MNIRHIINMLNTKFVLPKNIAVPWDAETAKTVNDKVKYVTRVVIIHIFAL